MIVRVWRGRAAASNERAYVQHLTKNVFAKLREIDGFRGASLLKKSRDGNIEFVVMTRWTSMEAIRVFAGADPRKAVVEPAAEAVLLDFDREVEYYEVAAEVSGARNS